MDLTLILYGLAVAWFTHTCFRIASLIYQFEMFPRSYGRAPAIALGELADLAEQEDRDLPSFRVVVPAYQEAAVIEATARRLASLNYPRTHFDIHVITYEDEPPVAPYEPTYAVATRAADDINGRAGRRLVRPILVPSGYDGSFPGRLDAGEKERFVGKARGLNFALRTIHEENERDERTHYIACMARRGHIERVDRALAATREILAQPAAARAVAARLCAPESPEYLGALAMSRQLGPVLDLVLAVRPPADAGDRAAWDAVRAYAEREAARFFAVIDWPESGDGVATRVMAGKEFLHRVMLEVEAAAMAELETRTATREQALERERPRLFAALAEATKGEEIFQLVRRMNSRWLLVYDADADAPVDLLRYLAARILCEPSVMGFQGPVAPVANYDEVHPLCRLGGLWMGFWHGTNYPRLMSRPAWAHPLAGTNWCFRIEGSERDGRLIRDCPYDEARRHFLLSFDPAQLTEDLEAGIRIFNDWKVNAEWHPFVEFEQVPPTPRAMIVQRTRWTLGTLQTLGYILRSRLPLLQKCRFALHPLEIMVSGSGPLITLFLWILLLMGELESRPMFATWTFILTAGNVLYVVSFLRAYTRFDGIFRRATAFDQVRGHGAALLARLADVRGRDSRIGPDERARLRRLRDALDRPGWITAYLRDRCLDSEDGESGESGQGDASAQARALARLIDATPTRVRGRELSDLGRALGEFLERTSGAPDAPDTPDAGERPPAPDAGVDEQLAALERALDMGRRRASFRNRDARNRVQIWVWTFPYLFFQLIPYFKGLWRWGLRRSESRWHKTPRTPKAIGSAGGVT